jgi:hypothetical protein
MMNKLANICFSLVVALFLGGAAFGCPAGDDCPATEITINSFGIDGRVVLVDRGRQRRAGWVTVDAFYFRQGEWQSIGSSSGFGSFGWEADVVGTYKFIVRHEGVKPGTLILNVRRLKGKWNEFVVALKADGCARARLTRVGVP